MKEVTLEEQTSEPAVACRAKTPSPKLVSTSAVYLLTNVLNAAIPFALLPVLTRYLSPAEYGRVAMFQTLVGAIGAVIGVGMAAALTRKYYEPDLSSPDARDFLGACVQLLVIVSLIVLALLLPFSSPLGGFLGLDAKWIPWAIPVAMGSVLIQIRLTMWQVRGRAASYGAFQVGQSVSNVVLSLLFVTVLLLGAAGRITAQSLSVVVFAAAGLLVLRRDGAISLLSWRPQFLKELIAYGVPLIPHVLSAFVLFSIDRVVITTELGLTNAGIYVVAAQLAGVVSLLFDAVGKAYTPWLFECLARGDETERARVVRSTYAWFLLFLVGAGVAFLVGPPIVVMIAGERYAGGGEVLGWLVLGQCFMGMYALLSNYLMYAKRTGVLSLVTVVSASVYLLLLLILVRMLGLKGAAIAYAAGMAFRLGATWWAAHRCEPMPWFALLAPRRC
ncbi:lipopolysaccharide biosynthesis protein [Ramlibacter sp. AN1133]|uniref:lipopolysaccharide biosynthesis protein n=1 Tax=Ramlibacter sp. AN1133 TaxID=3133429 RepID=UPI0030C0A146